MRRGWGTDSYMTASDSSCARWQATDVRAGVRAKERGGRADSRGHVRGFEGRESVVNAAPVEERRRQTREEGAGSARQPVRVPL